MSVRNNGEYLILLDVTRPLALTCSFGAMKSPLPSLHEVSCARSWGLCEMKPSAPWTCCEISTIQWHPRLQTFLIRFSQQWRWNVNWSQWWSSDDSWNDTIRHDRAWSWLACLSDCFDEVAKISGTRNPKVLISCSQIMINWSAAKDRIQLLYFEKEDFQFQLFCMSILVFVSQFCCFAAETFLRKHVQCVHDKWWPSVT